MRFEARREPTRLLPAAALLAVLGLTFHPGAVDASRLPDVDLHAMARESSTIVRGRVLGLESRWSPDGSRIETEVRLAVGEMLKGEVGREIAITFPGGRVGDKALKVSGSPTFEAGEEVLLFLSKGRGGELRLTSLGLSKLEVELRDGRPVKVGHARLPLAKLVPGAAAKSDARGRISWEDLRLALQSPAPAGKATSGPQPTQTAASEPGFHLIEGGTLDTVCPQESSDFLRWDLREFPGSRVPYEVDGVISEEHHDQPAAAAVVRAVRRAANRWSNVVPAHIELFDNTQADPCPIEPTEDQRNCITWDPEFDVFGVYAITFHWEDLSVGEIIESDIVANATLAWTSRASDVAEPPYGIEGIMVHEFGHFVGLDHPDEFDAGPDRDCGDDDPGCTTRMCSVVDTSRRALRQADRDGLNYLYTADLGDLGAPYPTSIHSGVPSGFTISGVELEVPGDGPAHLFGIFGDPPAGTPRYQYEWLGFPGGAIDDDPAEEDALAEDNFDDGVAIIGKCKSDGYLESPLDVLIYVQTASDIQGRAHDYTTDPMYLNGWFDFDDNGSLEDVVTDGSGTFDEHVIGKTQGGFSVVAQGMYSFRLEIPEEVPCDVKSRFRLDWQEDVGQVAAFADVDLVRRAAYHGEVEDYVGLYKKEDFPHLPGDPRWPGYCHRPHPLSVTFPVTDAEAKEICHPPEEDLTTLASEQNDFPAAGEECMDSTLSLKLDVDSDGIVDDELGLSGPVCVTRSEPYLDAEGLRTIDTEMVSLDMIGYSRSAGVVEVRLAPGTQSLGRIRQSEAARALGVDLSLETPAESFFDVHFVVETEELGTSEPVGPARVDADLLAVPPGAPNGDSPGGGTPGTGTPGGTATAAGQ